MSPGKDEVESLGERCLREVFVGFVVIVVVVEDILDIFFAYYASFHPFRYTKCCVFVKLVFSINFLLTSTTKNTQIDNGVSYLK